MIHLGNEVRLVAVITGNTVVFGVTLCRTGGINGLTLQTDVNILTVFFEKNLCRINRNDKGLNVAVRAVFLPVEVISVCKLITLFGKELQVFLRNRNPAGDVVSVGVVPGILVRPKRSFSTAVDGVLDVLEVGGGKSLGSVDFNADPPAVLISAD